MHKVVVFSLLSGLLLPGVPAFAQFKDPVKAAINLANLDRVVARASVGSCLDYPVIIAKLPPKIVPGNAIGLQRVKMPQTITPVNQSYIALLNTFHKRYNAASSFVTPTMLAPWAAKEWIGDQESTHVFYTDQITLARDLDAFYKGNAPLWVDSSGRRAKLYMLPVDGILYQPVGSSVPLVLTSDEYFVIYDINTQTGQLAENKPEVYNLFRPVYEEIWQAMGASKELDDLGNLCDAILMAHLHYARIEQLGGTSSIETLVAEGRGIVWRQLNNQTELLDYVQRFPKVRNVSTGIEAYVIDLPVEGLAWLENNTTLHAYTPREHVMLFFEMDGVGIFQRADVQNPGLFTPVAK